MRVRKTSRREVGTTTVLLCTYQIVLDGSVGTSASCAFWCEKAEFRRMAEVLTTIRDMTLLAIFLDYEYVRQSWKTLCEVRAVAAAKLVHSQNVMCEIGRDKQAVLKYL